MDLSNSAVKTPDAESEIATQIRPANPPASSNRVLKRHTPLYLHHGHPVAVMYNECLKNHAASLGGHAVDGCGEFMPSSATKPADPSSLKCAACGCHRIGISTAVSLRSRWCRTLYSPLDCIF